jgi:hypothetical protein
LDGPVHDHKLAQDQYVGTCPCRQAEPLFEGQALAVVLAVLTMTKFMVTALEYLQAVKPSLKAGVIIDGFARMAHDLEPQRR